LLGRTALCLSTAALAAFSVAASSVAAPSDIDRTFGKRGIARPLLFGPVGSLIALGDGRYLGTAGSLQRVGGPVGSLFAMRPSGDLDTSFGSNGSVSFAEPPPFGRRAVPFEVLRQPGDRFVVSGGSPFQHPGQLLVRYTREGVVDGSFGSDGRVVFEEGYAGKVVARADGSLVGLHVTCTGEHGDQCSRTLFALTADGRVDEAFGTNGVVADVPGTLMTAYPDGRIVLAGATPAGAVSVVRYTADGRPDPEFGRGGVALLVGPDPKEEPRPMLATADGKLIVLTSSAQGTTVTRLMPDGSFDQTFGFGGRISVGKVSLTALALQRDGKLLVAGTPAFALFRFTSHGRLDMGFGQRGRAFTDPNAPVPASPDAPYISSVGGVLVDADGKILLAGGEHPVIDEYPILARYKGGRSVSPPGPRYSIHISGGGKRLQVGETIRVGLSDRFHRNQRLSVCVDRTNPPPGRSECRRSRTGERRTTRVLLSEAGDIGLRFRIQYTGELIVRTLHVHRR
jgi:uncharacterized delta-60 repeat protein